jgi:hypothetical protein
VPAETRRLGVLVTKYVQEWRCMMLNGVSGHHMLVALYKLSVDVAADGWSRPGRLPDLASPVKHRGTCRQHFPSASFSTLSNAIGMAHDR